MNQPTDQVPSAGPCRRRLHTAAVVLAVAAVAEAGLFVVLPVTAVWQAATALGLTTSLAAHVLVGFVAVAAVTVVASLCRRGSRSRPMIAAVLAAGYAATGSGLVPLLGALLFELAGGRREVAVAAPLTAESAPARRLELVPGATPTTRHLDAGEGRPR